MSTTSTTTLPYFPPVLPAQFRAALPDLNSGNVCQQLSKAAEFDKLWAQFYSWMVTEDGEPGPNFSQWICSINCGSFTTTSSTSTGTGTTTATTTPAALEPVSNLLASQGHGGTSVQLIFTPALGADSYDFYVGTTTDPDDAVLIEANRFAFNNSTRPASCIVGGDPRYACSLPRFTDNGNELIYIHPLLIPDESPTAVMYYFVVAKNSVSGAVSVKSNYAAGWAQGFGTDGFAQEDSMTSGNAARVFTAGYTRCRVVLYGAGAGGAGGAGTFGGGGGGGGCLLYGEFTIGIPGTSKYRVVATPNAGTGNAASAADGADGTVVTFEYNDLGDDVLWVPLFTADAAGGGKYLNTGGGAGGAGASGSVDGSVINSSIFDGRDGEPGVAGVGGRSGNPAFKQKLPGAHYSGSPSWTGNESNGVGGGGSWAIPAAPSTATGGSSDKNGRAQLWFLP